MEQNDIVYGVHAVVESLEANTGNKLYIQDDLRGKMLKNQGPGGREEGVDFFDAQEDPV